MRLRLGHLLRGARGGVAAPGGDIVQPQYSSANIDAAGTTLTVVVSENVTGGTSGDGGFTLSPSGGAVSLTYSSSPNAQTRTYIISRTILQTETVNLAYSPGDIEDAAGNDLATFAGQTITNNSTQQPPPSITIQAASASQNSTLVQLSFTGNADGSDGFTLTINGNGSALSYSSGIGTALLSFNAADTIQSGDSVRVAYSPGNVTGLASFSDYSVTVV